MTQYRNHCSNNLNMILAMNMGGDDFVVKPFDLDFLLAKSIPCCGVPMIFKAR